MEKKAFSLAQESDKFILLIDLVFKCSKLPVVRLMYFIY